jgi:hypothetical protein
MQLNGRAGAAGSPHRLNRFDDALGPDHAADYGDFQRRRRRLLTAGKIRGLDARSANDGYIGAGRV